MTLRNRRTLWWIAVSSMALFVAARFYLRHIGRPDDADICTVCATILMIVTTGLSLPTKQSDRGGRD